MEEKLCEVEIDTGDVILSCLVAGNEGDPVVIALHGFPDTRLSFRPLLPALLGAGYRVVMPALRGYRPSGVARSGRHDAIAAGRDAIFLANHFSPNAQVRLIGHDWGAVAAFAVSAFASDRVSHLVTMAVPHLAVAMPRLFRPAQMRRSWYVGLFQIPGVAEARLAKDDYALVDRLWRDWSPGYVATDEEMQAVKQAIRGERIGPVLQYYRALRSPSILIDAEPVFGMVHVPSIHLHGVDDGCIGVECVQGAEKHYCNGYSFFPVAGAGHFLVQEKPAVVSEHITTFFAC